LNYKDNISVRGKKEMFRRVVCLMILGLVLSALAAIAVDSDKDKTALSVSVKWLDMIDKGMYGPSWEETAFFFQNRVTRDQWKKTLERTRKPLGKPLSRELKTIFHKESIPDLPRGEYIIIEFETSFINKKILTETVIPVLEKDGRWKVTRYLING
jgi:hypothetical protein